MIRCVTPAYKDIWNICENSDRSDKAVILIVNSAWAKEVALAQFKEDGYEPKIAKLNSIKEWMTQGGELNPSIMHISRDGITRFDEGRTRAIVADEKGYHDYPIATTYRHAMNLKQHWGSVSRAKKVFDFTECWDHIDNAIILGNP